MSSKCAIVDCGEMECIKEAKCGSIQWFGNLTECAVMLQYNIPPSKTWFSMGVFQPGEHMDLAQGALYLPSKAQMRAIKADSGEVLTNYGEIGQGIHSLYIDSDMCRPTAQAPAQTPVASPTAANSSVWVWFVLTGLIVVVVTVAAFKRRSSYRRTI